MKLDRNSLAPEVATLRIKAAGQRGTAVAALTLRIDTVMVDLVPVAHDQRRVAIRGTAPEGPV